MNVLIVATYSRYSGKRVGGAEISLQLIAEKLAQCGERVFFVTQSKSMIPGLRKKEINGVTVYFTRTFRWPYLKGLLFPKIGEQFVATQRRRHLAHIIRKEKIDVVHAYATFNDTFDVLKVRDNYPLNFKVVKRIAGLFWAYQLHEGDVTKEDVEWVFNNVDLINYLSPGLKELVYTEIRKYKIDYKPKKEIILDIGIDLEYFKYHWIHKNNPDFKIICVARFAQHQKCQDVLIQALSRVGPKNITVDFIGSGLALEDCKNLCRKLGLDNRVTFHGYVTRKQLIQFVSNADLFALPTKYEGLPKAWLEAMAIGIPCLVSDVVPLNNYIEDGINGFVAVNTPEQWATKIERIYNIKDGLKDVSLKGRDFVVKNYDARINISKYQEEFKKL